ncbi:MAG TPA: penicillin-binding transpeptidase domain-containing protein [Gaiellaceae bacterium]|nr:penicillin-binding transpeptidase domain-containing protein [Gaiellaceae bacterium]
MNRQLLRLSVLSMVLLAVLIGATTYWQSWAGADLANRQDNAVEAVAQLQIHRGRILASNGQVLAWSTPHRKKGLTIYSRHYPTNGLFSQIVGYATSGDNQVGLEQSYDDYLTGANTNLSNVLQSTLDRLGGETVHGDDVYLTVKPALQALALHDLAGRCGAVVAMNPKTGAIYAMASSPTYNQNLIEQPSGFGKIKHVKGSCGDASALVDNATAGLYPPGSTFKLVTASAALDTGIYKPTSPFYDPGYCIDYGKPVYNASAPDSPGGHEAYGNVDLSEALEHSINAVFCKVGEHIGAARILEYAKRYGFYAPPPLDLPPDESQASGLYNHGKLWYPKDPDTQVDSGRLAFGQERMLVTPLQMALVASTIADGGAEPKPYLVQKIVAHDGSTVAKTSPQVLGHPIKPSTAAELNQMMQLVVQGGTGTNAQIPGVEVAGKTGTAEIGLGDVYDAWFVCFAPANHPKIAVAVAVEKQPNGFGGSVAAPIAKDILEKLLGG